MPGTEWLRLMWRRDFLPAVPLVFLVASCVQQSRDDTEAPVPPASPAVPGASSEVPGGRQDPGAEQTLPAVPESRADPQQVLRLMNADLHFLFTVGRSPEQARLLYLRRSGGTWETTESAASDERMQIGAEADLQIGADAQPFVRFSALLLPALERPRMVYMNKTAASADEPRPGDRIEAAAMPEDLTGTSDCAAIPHVRRESRSNGLSYVLFTCTVGVGASSGQACQLRLAVGRENTWTSPVTLAVTDPDRPCGVFTADRPSLSVGADGQAHVVFRARKADADGWTVGYLSGDGTDFDAPYYMTAADGGLTGFTSLAVTGDAGRYVAWLDGNTPRLLVGSDISQMKKVPVPLSLRSGEMIFAMSGFLAHRDEGGRR